MDRLPRRERSSLKASTRGSPFKAGFTDGWESAPAPAGEGAPATAAPPPMLKTAAF
ncbi:MAG: hypothetical protein ACOVN5_07455 [Aquidulcibacter sp.]